MIQLSNEIPTRVYFWNKERGLLVEPIVDKELSYLLEELSEFFRAKNVYDRIDALADLVVFSLGWLAKLNEVNHTFITNTRTFSKTELIGLVYDIAEPEWNHEDEVVTDLLVQLIDLCLTGMLTLGFEPNIVMEEVLLHIESRKGSVGDSGKWEKDTSVTPYVQQFDRAKLQEVK